MRLREMMDRADAKVPVPENYAPKVMRGMEAAMKEPEPMPNSSDEVVKNFLAMGEHVAKSLEEWGDYCEKKGQERKAECYAAAATTRKKADYQAREAGLLIDDFAKMRSLSNGEKRVTHTPEEKTDG